MKFKLTILVPWNKRNLFKMIMRTFIFLFSSVIFALSPNNGLSQNAKIRIDENKIVTIDEAFSLIKNQTDYSFVYSSNLFENAPKVELEKGNIKAYKLLEKCLSKTVFTYRFTDDEIIILNRKPAFVGTDLVELPQQNISGIVTDQDGNPMPGVNVFVGAEGSSIVRGVTTDLEGKYNIDVIKGEVIKFSYVGYVTQEFIIDAQTEINVLFEEDTSNLDQVVVIGYGTAKRSELTGSISSANVSDLSKISEPNIGSALAGLASGIHVSKESGEPGSSASIQIRGYSSIQGSNEPLYVIDGIPFQPRNNASVGDMSNPLNTLDPSDIEQIDILKDASSTAIYGSRAANGVIIITTKKGKAGELVADLNYKVSFQTISKRFKVLNKQQYLDVVQEAHENAGKDFDSATYDLGGNTNWQDEAMQTAIMHVTNLSLRGSSSDNKTLYSTFFSMTDQDGTVQPSYYKRYYGKLNITSSLWDRVTLGTNLQYSYGERISGSDYTGIAFTRPDLPRDEYIKGTLATNHFRVNKLTDRLGQNNTILGSVFGEVELIKGLRAKSAFYLDRSMSKSFSFRPREITNDGRSKRTDSRGTYTSLVWDNTLSYNTSIKEQHNIDVVGGASWTRNKSTSININSADFPDDQVLNNLGSANTILSSTDSSVENGLASYFLRARYNYMNKYYLTFTSRMDKSSKFGPNNRWAFFPSGGVAWDMSKENFMENTIFSQMKLRGSYGVTGLATFPDFLYRLLYETGSWYDLQNGISPINIPNDDIKWEKTKQTDIGLDYGLLGNRVTGSIGYFKKYTSDLIMFVPIPMEVGGGSLQIQNIGDISNTGWEFEIGGEIVRTKDLSWNASFNLSFQKNIIEKIDKGQISQFSNQKLKEGDIYGSLYGYRADGLFQTQEEIDLLNANAPDGSYQHAKTGPGDRKFVDLDGDGEITTDDVEIIGQTVPNFYGGLTNTFRYKNFELSAFLQFVEGINVISPEANSHSLSHSGNIPTNYTTKVLDAWTSSNTNTSQPRNVWGDPNQSNRFSNDLVEDASYIRLKNVQLSYKLNLGNNIKPTIFISGTNLLTFTKYGGQDPEATRFSLSTGGSGSYPFGRTITMGLNVKF